ncbi:MAG: hypothetical protein ACYSWW_16790 [Planctomycetota bacterium]
MSTKSSHTCSEKNQLKARRLRRKIQGNGRTPVAAPLVGVARAQVASKLSMMVM